MPINFLDPNCATNSSNIKFGICDDPPPATSPAYIDINNVPNWIAIVNNPSQENVKFYAIDNCVIVLRTDGSIESRCDGVLNYSTKLIFVELKSRQSGQWLKKGREQLTITINNFIAEHDITVFTNIEAYVSNNLKPLAHSGQAGNILQFYRDTGFILRGKRIIDII